VFYLQCSRRYKCPTSRKNLELSRRYILEAKACGTTLFERSVQQAVEVSREMAQQSAINLVCLLLALRTHNDRYHCVVNVTVYLVPKTDFERIIWKRIALVLAESHGHMVLASDAPVRETGLHLPCSLVSVA